MTIVRGPTLSELKDRHLCMWKYKYKARYLPKRSSQNTKFCHKRAMSRSRPQFPRSTHGTPWTMSPLLARKSVAFSDSGFPYTEARVIKHKAESLIKIWTKFLDMVIKGPNRKDHSASAIFLIYSIFNHRNEMSLFSRKAFDKFITMKGKKVGCPCSLVSHSHFSTDRPQCQGKSAMFLMR